MARTFYLETLGCPKNQVDSDKLAGRLAADGYESTDDASAADLVVVNTCAFVEEARQESIDTVLGLAEERRPGARLVVTGCLAERYGEELAEALPEVDTVAGFGTELAAPLMGAGHSAAPLMESGHLAPATPVVLGRRPAAPAFDLLNLPRPRSPRPWAYIKIAEGCDRACGFCAIPSFRGPQRSRTIEAVLDEVNQLDVREVVLVAQDLASYGRDQGQGRKAIVPLVKAVAAEVDRVRLLYLYPSELTDRLVDTICDTGVPYFDLSLQHVSRPLLRRMKRWGDGGRFLERIAAIRAREPDAAFRTNFIVGYPGETEADHDQLLAFVEEARLDWCGFFAYSAEAGTYAVTLGDGVAEGLVADRLAELREMQDRITTEKRVELVGSTVEVLVDEPGVARSFREAPEIDGIIVVPDHLTVGELFDVAITGVEGPDLEADDGPMSASDGQGSVEAS